MKQKKIEKELSKVKMEKVDVIATQSARIKELEDKIQELEKLRWQYAVGDIVLYKPTLRCVEITKLIDNHKYGYLYEGRFVDNCTSAEFTNDDLMVKPWDYEKLLQEKVIELYCRLNHGK